MLTAKIYLSADGSIATMDKDFPIYQGQFNNILLNLYVPVALLAPQFRVYASASDTEISPYTGGTAVSVGMKTVARNGKYVESEKFYLRYVKTLTYKGADYALFERKMPKAFTAYEGTGSNAASMIFNIVNIALGEIQKATAKVESNTISSVDVVLSTVKLKFTPVTMSYTFTYYSLNGKWLEENSGAWYSSLSAVGINIVGDAVPQNGDKIILTVVAEPSTVTQIGTTQRVTYDVVASNRFDSEPTIEDEAQWEQMVAQVNNIAAELPNKQNRNDIGLDTNSKYIVPSINEVNAKAVANATDISKANKAIDGVSNRVTKLEGVVGNGENYIGTKYIPVGDQPVTNDYLTSFAKSIKGEDYVPQPSDVIIGVLEVDLGTDKNIKYIYNGNTNNWDDIPAPPVENATNNDVGIVRGNYLTSGQDNDPEAVSIESGAIKGVYILGKDGNYRGAASRINENTQYIDDVKAGTVKVAKSVSADNDGDGKNIAATYMTNALGATKDFVKEYALPAAFNDVKYVAGNGSSASLYYSSTVPSEPEDGIILTKTIDTVEDTSFCTIEDAVNDATFQLSAKNGYKVSMFISADGGEKGNLTLQSYLVSPGHEDTLLSAEMASFTIGGGEITRVDFSSNFLELGDTVVTLDADAGQYIKHVLILRRSDAYAIDYHVYSNSVYPSTFYLFVGTQALIKGRVVQSPGDSETDVMSQKATTNLVRDSFADSIYYPHGTATARYDNVDGISLHGDAQVTENSGNTRTAHVDAEIPLFFGNGLKADADPSQEKINVEVDYVIVPVATTDEMNTSWGTSPLSVTVSGTLTADAVANLQKEGAIVDFSFSNITHLLLTRQYALEKSTSYLFFGGVVPLMSGTSGYPYSFYFRVSLSDNKYSLNYVPCARQTEVMSWISTSETDMKKYIENNPFMALIDFSALKDTENSQNLTMTITSAVFVDIINNLKNRYVKTGMVHDHERIFSPDNGNEFCLFWPNCLTYDENDSSQTTDVVAHFVGGHNGKFYEVQVSGSSASVDTWTNTKATLVELDAYLDKPENTGTVGQVLAKTDTGSQWVDSVTVQVVNIDSPAEVTNGTLTAAQLATLQASDQNYIMFNHEKYYLGDKGHQEGLLTYSHVGYENGSHFLKSITITISTLAWVLNTTECASKSYVETYVNSLNGNEVSY